MLMRILPNARFPRPDGILVFGDPWINSIRPRIVQSHHERVDSRFLVFSGSECTITEITEYIYFSPENPCREIKYKSDENTVPVYLIIEPILFLWNTILTFYYTRVRPQCDYSILGRVEKWPDQEK